MWKLCGPQNVTILSSAQASLHYWRFCLAPTSSFSVFGGERANIIHILLQNSDVFLFKRHEKTGLIGPAGSLCPSCFRTWDGAVLCEADLFPSHVLVTPPPLFLLVILPTSSTLFLYLLQNPTAPNRPIRLWRWQALVYRTPFHCVLLGINKTGVFPAAPGQITASQPFWWCFQLRGAGDDGGVLEQGSR